VKKNMRKKTIVQLGIYLVLVIIVIITIFAISTNQIELPGTVTTQDSSSIENVTITIISDNWSVTHTYIKTTNNTVYSLLNQTAQRYHFSVNKTYFTGYDSFFIESINGIPNGMTNKYWQFEVNGQYGNKGCSHYILSDDDVVIWRFQKSPF
jgi:hypothetical protein